MDQAGRVRRREEARRRQQRQRRRVLAVLAAAVLLAVLVPLGLALGGGSSSRSNAAGAGAGHPAAPELPRGGRAIFPRYRVVAYYGAPQDPQLGELGIGTPDHAVRRLEKQARPYARGRPVMPALELIAVVAAGASYGGRYSFRQSDAVIRRYLAAARRHKAILMLDIQPGHADFMAEVRHLRPYLEQPDVSLALDPEWHVPAGQVPGRVIGSTDAATVNQVSSYLAGIVRARRLPQKLLVVHQFTDAMIRDKQALRQQPGVALTLNVDGFGPIPVKVAKYKGFARASAGTHHGFKLFYHEDPVLMKPRAVLRLRPRPEFVVYE